MMVDFEKCKLCKYVEIEYETTDYPGGAFITEMNCSLHKNPLQYIGNCYLNGKAEKAKEGL